MIDPISLISLVKGVGTTLGIGSDSTSVGQTVGASNSQSFVDVLKNTTSNMVHDLSNAETMSAKGITGDASTRDVVDAVMDADRSLQTAMAIRDKVVSAYLDVTKMPI